MKYFLQLAEAPDWLYDFLLGEKRANSLGALLHDQYIQQAVAGESYAVASAAVGSRNARLNEAAFKLGTLAQAGDLSPSSTTSLALWSTKAAAARLADRMISAGAVTITFS